MPPKRAPRERLMDGMIAELLRVADERRRYPRGDILSELVALEIEDGRNLRDDELIGVLCAARRVQSWQAAIELEAVSDS